MKKDVVLNKKINVERNGFYKLLEKICKDFNINDSEKTIENFIKKQ